MAILTPEFRQAVVWFLGGKIKRGLPRLSGDAVLFPTSLLLRSLEYVFVVIIKAQRESNAARVKSVKPVVRLKHPLSSAAAVEN